MVLELPVLPVFQSEKLKHIEDERRKVIKT